MGITKNSQLKHKKPELVAPAGDLNKLKTAIEYGADAVYAGGKEFNLRNAASNFSLSDIEKAVVYVHERNKKIYIPLNIFAHNHHIPRLEQYIKELSKYPVDALIVSDPGIIEIVKDILPEMPIHLSTQANCTNRKSAEFWFRQGVKRIVLAREMTLDEISDTSSDGGYETEVFVHGAMCISYSGRCYLSSYMADRGANLGDCAQPCRWKYSIVEEKRPNEFFDVFEEGGLTSVMSSRDLCMIQYIPELISAGVDAWKIEGRMKSQYYVAAVTRIYREAIDAFFENDVYEYQDKWVDELEKVSHRGYCKGFFFGSPGANGQSVSSGDGYIRTHKILGLLDRPKDGKFAEVLVKNKIEVGSDVEIMGKSTNQDFVQNIGEMFNQEMEPIKEAHPGQRIFVIPERPVEKYFMMREMVKG
jgi:U32 family peptidase